MLKTVTILRLIPSAAPTTRMLKAIEMHNFVLNVSLATEIALNGVYPGNHIFCESIVHFCSYTAAVFNKREAHAYWRKIPFG